ncbi:hypothetical protein GN244_ATG08149 [Phytophthora infestans]|uniref:Uncharacterized protein n=1 Tax=Phytophthora infestans TaxID=4787 RepID=A0A833TEL5_PHYIN|nr:hypothetical protein GN244_ATG08149 [Phytophthora infestans]
MNDAEGSDDEVSEGKEELIDFAKRWHAACGIGYELEISPTEWIERPQQPDAVSGGVFVVAQGYSYLTGGYATTRAQSVKERCQPLMLWMVVCRAFNRLRV